MPRPSGGKRQSRSARSPSARSSTSKVDVAGRASAALAARRRARRLYSTAEVMRAIHRMVAEVTARLKHANPVVLAVMHGGVFPAVGLCKRVGFPHEFDYVH